MAGRGDKPRVRIEIDLARARASRVHKTIISIRRASRTNADLRVGAFVSFRDKREKIRVRFLINRHDPIVYNDLFQYREYSTEYTVYSVYLALLFPRDLNFNSTERSSDRFGIDFS